MCACYIILPNSLISTKTELCIVLWVFLVCFSLLQLLDACCVYNFPTNILCEDCRRRKTFFPYFASHMHLVLILSLSLSLFINHYIRRFVSFFSVCPECFLYSNKNFSLMRPINDVSIIGFLFWFRLDHVNSFLN